MNLLRFLCFALLAWHSADAAADLSTLTFIYHGEPRSYEFFVPPTYDGTASLPLVLALHGRGGNGERMAHLTGFDARAAEHHFFVAYPDSPHGYWNYLHSIPGAARGPDDVDFLKHLIDAVGREYRLDRKRLYVAGISDGGFMAQRLACEADSRFAAFASVAASAYGAMPATCHAHTPVDALYLHGTADELVPWQGRRVVDPGGEAQRVTLSITDSVKYWSGLNRCDPQLVVHDLPRSGRSPETHVRVYASKACADDARVMLYAIIGGGHNWPGTDGLIPPHISGAVNLDFHATDVIWSFFERAGSRQ